MTQAEINITIPINPVTKKNHGRIVNNNGRQYMLPSEQFERYQRECRYWLSRYRNRVGFPIMDRVEVECHFYRKTRHNVDLVNLLQSIDDVLVHYGVLDDDNSQIIASHDGSRVHYDKNNPRTEITIKRIKE